MDTHELSQFWSWQQEDRELYKSKRFREKRKLYLLQEGKCAICNRHLPEVRKAHYDHDHVTEVYRGLLCRQCNVGLGMFQDSAKILRLAAEYLEVHDDE